MEVIHSRCAGMDVSKRDAKVCVRIAGGGRRKTVETVRTWAATTNSILALREHLVAEQVSLVVMEATGDYWKPVYFLLEREGFDCLLYQASQVKALPGRPKTDWTPPGWPGSPSRGRWRAASCPRRTSAGCARTPATAGG